MKRVINTPINFTALDYLSLENTTALKGIMAMSVVISHIYSHGSFQFDNAILHFIFSSWGTYL